MKQIYLFVILDGSFGKKKHEVWNTDREQMLTSIKVLPSVYFMQTNTRNLKTSKYDIKNVYNFLWNEIFFIAQCLWAVSKKCIQYIQESLITWNN